MANRRGRHSIQNILNGESDFEREERYSQKKDYAAALQEQIRQKNESKEREKARKLEDLQAEREAMSRDRGVILSPRHMEKNAQPFSPIKAVQPGTEFPNTSNAFTPVKINVIPPLGHGTISALSPTKTFNTTQYTFTSSSIFEDFFQGDQLQNRKAKFQVGVDAILKLRGDIELMWKQNLSAAEALYVKPNFVLASEKVGSDNPLLATVHLEEAEIMATESPIDDKEIGLSGNSVLIPLSGDLGLVQPVTSDLTQATIEGVSELIHVSTSSVAVPIKH